MKKIGKWLCMLFILCSSFCFSINTMSPSKASIVRPPLIPGEGGSSGGSCETNIYYEASFTDPTEPDYSLTKHSEFYTNPELFESGYGLKLNLENLYWLLESHLYFYKATIDTCGSSDYEIIDRGYNPIDFSLSWSNNDNWDGVSYGIFNFTADLKYKNTSYFATAKVWICEDYIDFIDITGIFEYEAKASEQLLIDNIMSNISIKSRVNDFEVMYSYDDQYSDRYSQIGIHKIFITAEINVNGTWYSKVQEIVINVKDDIGPIFKDNLNQVIVSNTVVLKPQALFNFLDLEDNYDSRDKLEIQVVKNTYEYASLELGEYEFVLIAKDSSGNFSLEKTIKVIVVDDILLPMAITNTNIVLSNSYLEADALAHAVAYVNGFSSRAYSYKLDNDDYKNTQYSYEATDRASQVDVEFTFEDDSTIEKSLLFKTVSENYLSNNVNAGKYNSAGSKFIRFLKMLWDMLLWLLEKLFGWLI